MFNNLAKRNPFQRLIVEARCIDCRLDDRLEYSWKLFLLEGVDETLDESWEEKADWEDKTATGLSSSSLVIEPGYLLSGKNYRLQLFAWKAGGDAGYVIEVLFMNIAPADGWCRVPISEGFALETEFKVKCEGWKDDDKPLSYLIGNPSQNSQWYFTYDCHVKKTVVIYVFQLTVTAGRSHRKLESANTNLQTVF